MQRNDIKSILHVTYIYYFISKFIYTIRYCCITFGYIPYQKHLPTKYLT